MSALQEANPSRIEIPMGHNFGAVYADPPWPIDTPTTMYSRRRVIYDRMSAEEIIAMADQVKSATHPDGHCWMWTTNSHLKLALDVLDAWGYEFKTMGTWRKTKIGQGWWLRSRTEHLLFGARTNNLRHNPGNWTTEIEGEWRGHSVKPEGTYERIESLSPGPYLELFSRQPEHERPGWMTLGSPSVPSEPFGQISVRRGARRDPGDGKVRGVGGLEIVEGQKYVRLVKTLTPVECTAISQKGRRVTIEINGEKKSVTIDSLREVGWTP